MLDKRRLHLSSLIVSGQISRDEALDQVKSPIASTAQSERDVRFVAKKLRIPRAELDGLIDSPPISHDEYSSDLALHRTLMKFRAGWRGRQRQAVS